MAACRECGAEISFAKTGELKPDGKPKYLVRNPDGSPHKCRAAPGQTQDGPKMYRGVLKTLLPAQKTIVLTTQRGDLTFHMGGSLWGDVEDIPPGTMIELPHDAKGAILGVRVLETAEKPPVSEFQTAKEIQDQDRVHGPADGECITEPLVRPPQKPTAPETTSTSSLPVRSWSGETTLTIGITVNLDNYENLRLEVSGSTADREQLIQYLNDTLGRFGQGSPVTREKIEAYRKRVIG